MTPCYTPDHIPTTFREEWKHCVAEQRMRNERIPTELGEVACLMMYQHSSRGQLEDAVKAVRIKLKEDKKEIPLAFLPFFNLTSKAV